MSLTDVVVVIVVVVVVVVKATSSANLKSVRYSLSSFFSRFSLSKV